MFEHLNIDSTLYLHMILKEQNPILEDEQNLHITIIVN